MQKQVIYNVEITNCSNKMYWYNDFVGKQFKCTIVDNQSLFWPALKVYRTVDPVKIKGFATTPIRSNILITDCKIIE